MLCVICVICATAAAPPAPGGCGRRSKITQPATAIEQPRAALCDLGDRTRLWRITWRMRKPQRCSTGLFWRPFVNRLAGAEAAGYIWCEASCTVFIGTVYDTAVACLLQMPKLLPYLEGSGSGSRMATAK